MTPAASGSVRKRMRFRKNFVICSHDLPFCVTIQCVVMGRQSDHATLTQTKRDLKKEKLSSMNDAWKGCLKI